MAFDTFSCFFLIKLATIGCPKGCVAKIATNYHYWIAEVESSRTSLASRTSSRTHFEVLGLGLEGQVLGLGLEASSPRKLACPRLEDSTIFWIVKILWSAWKIFWKTCFCGDRLKNFVKTFFLFWRALALMSLALASSIPVLGLESVCPRNCCPWPRIFFVSLALASSLVFSTPPLLDRLTDIFAVGKVDYGVMVRYQNLTWEPDLLRAPWARAPLGPGTMYPLNPPLAGPGWE